MGIILTYHHIYKEFRNNLDVEKDIFEKQILLLLESNKKFTYLDEYDPEDPACAVLRFDDGYKSLLKYALPVLKKYNLPFEVFIVSDFVSKKNMLNTFDLRKLVRHGARLEYHSKSHANLSLIEDINTIREEVITPDKLKKLDKNGFKFFAYPYWCYNNKVIDVLKEFYHGAVSGNGFARKDKDYMYKLDSIRMENHDKYKF